MDSSMNLNEYMEIDTVVVKFLQLYNKVKVTVFAFSLTLINGKTYLNA